MTLEEVKKSISDNLIFLNTRDMVQPYSNFFTRYMNVEAELNPSMLDPSLVNNYKEFVYKCISELIESRFICNEFRNLDTKNHFVDVAKK